MAFSEQRLPQRLAFGSNGGVERRTDIVTLASGFEQRSNPVDARTAALPDRGRDAHP